MQIFGTEISLRKKQLAQSLSPAANSGGGWFNALFPFLIREANSGDWQRNCVLSMENLLSNPTVFACITLIANDISKLRPMLRYYDEKKLIYIETESSAFSPVLNYPNHYQNRIEFFAQWITSLLTFGNTYVLKVRDNRNVVNELFVLDPRRVTAFVSVTGEVFYQLAQDNLPNLQQSNVMVPATEIIHDKINCIFHPLVGLSPLFGCGLAATQAIEIMQNSTRFFKKGATPSGIITIPGMVDRDKALEIKEAWAGGFTGANAGAVAVLADGAKFEQMTMKSTDSELVNQLKIADEKVCSAFHVPEYMVGVGSAPTYNNVEALNQYYYNSCLQVLIEKVELCLTNGLGMNTAKPQAYSVTMDISALLRMDTSARYTANGEAIKFGWKAPNEVRMEENLPPVKGGESPIMQQQNFSLAALAKRDAREDPFATTSTAPPPKKEEPAPAAEEEDDTTERAVQEFLAKAREVNKRAADAFASELDEVLNA